MPRYMITHSLLSSWLYAMKGNPYEDVTTEQDAYAEFLTVLRREPTPTNDAMQKGIDFENLVTAITEGSGDPSNDWYEAASKVAQIVKGAPLQVKASREIEVNGVKILLYGRLDALKAGIIRDIKFSTKYEKGKYIDSTQHPTYFEIVPEAVAFEYVISNGTDVWTERYEREETRSIVPIIAYFLDWLWSNGLMPLFEQKWVAA